jgi:hypothetical protein
VLQYGGAMKVPNTVANQSYADMHFVYDFCRGNGTTAVVEYRQRFHLCKIPHRKLFEIVHRTLRKTTSFRQADAQFTRVATKSLQNVPYFSQNQQEMSVIFSVNLSQYPTNAPDY